MTQADDETRSAPEGPDRPTAPGGAPPVEKRVGADWTRRPVDPADEARGVREDQPPEPEAVRREERQSRYRS